jgi:YidC/Oxa1 family membrane protein insertase
MIALIAPLQWLVDIAEVILKFWHSVGLSWGWSIVMLTVVVRIAILPLTYKGVRGMQNMQRLAPEMKRLQERYKDDRQRLNEEMMKFYREHGFNPASSCLPLLLQIPFFISIFYLLRDPSFKADIKGEESFLFITNLAAPETGIVLVVLMLLYVGTQLAASLVTAVSADRAVSPAAVRPDPDQLRGGAAGVLDHHQHLDVGAAARRQEVPAGAGAPRRGCLRCRRRRERRQA